MFQISFQAKHRVMPSMDFIHNNRRTKHAPTGSIARTRLNLWSTNENYNQPDINLEFKVNRVDISSSRSADDDRILLDAARISWNDINEAHPTIDCGPKCVSNKDDNTIADDGGVECTHFGAGHGSTSDDL